MKRIKIHIAAFTQTTNANMIRRHVQLPLLSAWCARSALKLKMSLSLTDKRRQEEMGFFLYQGTVPARVRREIRCLVFFYLNHSEEPLSGNTLRVDNCFQRFSY